MSALRTFNFHDRIGVQIESDDGRALAFFQAEYEHAEESVPAGQAHVHLSWRAGGMLPKAQVGFQSHAHKGLARWRYRMTCIPDGIRIEAAGNRLAIPMVHHMLVHPALRYLSSQQDLLLLHGAAVTYADQSLVFTGHGGAGKTTTSALLLQTGGSAWSPHADDYVFLAPGPQSMAYLTRSHLYRELFRWIPEMRQILRRPERLGVAAFGLIRSWSGDRIKWPVRVSLDRLWPDRQPRAQAQLAGLLLLRRADVRQPELREAELDEKTLHALLDMNFYEARHFIRLVQKGHTQGLAQDWLEQWRQREKALLAARLAEAPVYWLELPRDAAPDVQAGKHLMEQLLPLVDAEGRA